MSSETSEKIFPLLPTEIRFPEKHLQPFYERSNSLQTRRAYKRVVREFFRQFQGRHPNQITSE